VPHDEARPAIRGYRGERRLLLVVDDRLENRQVFQALLEPLGFPVATAESGEEGLERARALRPALVLMDLVMPGISGLEAVASMREDPELARIPVIATSATSTEPERCLQAGCDGFLPKPVDAAQLFELLGQLLGLEWEYEETAVLDAAAARAALLLAARLGEQIAAANLAASGCFADLRTALGPRLPQEMGTLAACLARLDFLGAVAPLREIRSALQRVAGEQ
jgi:CheY-like chemotaxis protein